MLDVSAAGQNLRQASLVRRVRQASLQVDISLVSSFVEDAVKLQAHHKNQKPKKQEITSLHKLVDFSCMRT